MNQDVMYVPNSSYIGLVLSNFNRENVDVSISNGTSETCSTLTLLGSLACAYVRVQGWREMICKQSHIGVYAREYGSVR